MSLQYPLSHYDDNCEFNDDDEIADVEDKTEDEDYVTDSADDDEIWNI